MREQIESGVGKDPNLDSELVVSEGFYEQRRDRQRQKSGMQREEEGKGNVRVRFPSHLTRKARVRDA
jgi:hypothetical protein